MEVWTTLEHLVAITSAVERPTRSDDLVAEIADGLAVAGEYVTKVDVVPIQHVVDFNWAAQAIAINRETGGNLSETLQRTAATIRERNQIRRQVKALSAEGRLSATILILLPIFVVLGVIVLRPEYLAPFIETPIGWAAMFVAFVLMVIGIVWMSAAVRVKF